MITIQQAIEVGAAGLVAVGALGTVIEAIGNLTASPKAVAFGKKLEAIGADLPKLLGKSDAEFARK